MTSRILPSFKKKFQDLPNAIKDEAQKVYELWKKNPFDRSLGFKRVHPSKPIYSVRITLNWRALGIREEKNTITWFWIGSHEEYNNLVKQLRK